MRNDIGSARGLPVGNERAAALGQLRCVLHLRLGGGCGWRRPGLSGGSVGSFRARRLIELLCAAERRQLRAVRAQGRRSRDEHEEERQAADDQQKER